MDWWSEDGLMMWWMNVNEWFSTYTLIISSRFECEQLAIIAIADLARSFQLVHSALAINKMHRRHPITVKNHSARFALRFNISYQITRLMMWFDSVISSCRKSHTWSACEHSSESGESGHAFLVERMRGPLNVSNAFQSRSRGGMWRHYMSSFILIAIFESPWIYVDMI